MARLWKTLEPDGRWRVRIHQSALGDSDLCLERFRFGIEGTVPDGTTDAVAVGTGLHAGAEASIEFFMEYGEWLPLEDVLTIAHEAFNTEMEHPDARWVKRQRVGSERFLTKAVTKWDSVTRPTLRPLKTEVKFGPYVLYEDENVIVEVAGAIDYVDETGLVDWKTGSKHGWEDAHWEKARWSTQATMYTYGWARYCEANGLDVSLTDDGGHPFTFVVYLDNGAVKHVPVVRRQGDWDWLSLKIRNLIPLLLSDLGHYPSNDQSALCSPKWCPFWAKCKGSVVDPRWPK